MAYHHIPVMLPEVIHSLKCRSGNTYVDCTLGGCGHAAAICSKIVPDGNFIGIDQDMDAIANAQRVLTPFNSIIQLFNDNFANLPAILSSLGIAGVDGILVDLGISLHQIESSGRGFSFSRDEPLDMRMDSRQSLTAADIVNRESETGLLHIFKEYGQERWARQIARRIVRIRKEERISSSEKLARIVSAAVPAKYRHRQSIHPATRIFMALRIAVNRELEMLETFLATAVDSLNPEGRLCVLAFHSLEDRMVKHRFRELARGCTCPPEIIKCVCGKKPIIRIITRKVQRPSETEIEANPAARSTRMRVVERLKGI